MIKVEIKEYKDGSLKDYSFDLESVLAEQEENKNKESEEKKTKSVEN
jgi:hypothetical protein